MNNRSHLKTNIRKSLRKEVGFGCPVKGCRLPFLEYHHFDPPYSEGQTHNVKGMIALCPTHHAQADNGAWSISDLHNMKKEKNREPLKGRLEWSIQDGILNAGNNLFFSPVFKLRILGQELFSLEQDHKGRIFINALLCNKEGKQIAQIKKNDIVAHDLSVGDLNCMASGKKVRIETLDNSSYFEVGFDRKPVEEVMNSFIGDEAEMGEEWIEDKVNDGMICLLTFKCKFQSKLVKVDITPSQIKLDFTKMGLDAPKLKGRFFGKNARLKIQGRDHSNKEVELIHFGRE